MQEKQGNSCGGKSSSAVYVEGVMQPEEGGLFSSA
jgi:hypothetical protein